MLQWLRRSLRDIGYGIHSNIPYCCVAWFVLVWPTLFMTPLARPYWERVDRMRGGGVDYIPCPLCLMLGRLVEIRDCEKSFCRCSWSRE